MVLEGFLWWYCRPMIRSAEGCSKKDAGEGILHVCEWCWRDSMRVVLEGLLGREWCWRDC